MITGGRVETFGRDWSALDGPTPRAHLDRATALAGELSGGPVSNLAADGDLHGEQVLAATRAAW